MSPTQQSGLKFDLYGFLAATAGTPQPPKLLARSASLDILAYELRRYMLNQVEGRSCLIAGPRGSGKTTLVASACKEAATDAPGCRLIQVRLHGPSLLNPPKPPRTSADQDPKPINLYEHVLKTLVINLYQTASEEIAIAFSNFIAFQGDEALELAAQLRLTLDGAPSPASLRFFWEKAGALPGGVLFPNPPTGALKSRPGQGASEIVAMATAAEAYRSCAGEYKAEQKDSRAVGDKQEAKAEVNLKGQDFSRALLGVASGVAAGSTAILASSPPALSALVGALTAIVSTVTLNYTRTLTRETTVKQEVTFLPDLRVSALVHRVPLLLRRLHDAGIAPIFIIDELDKVKNLSGPLNDLAGYLKFICADSAFFCFLTDRAYIAETARINRERTNAVQRTVFTNLLFILYEASSLHDYLARGIRPFGTSRQPALAELEADAEAFRYILIHRSRALLFELNRELGDFRRSDGSLNLAPGAPRSTLVHQFHLMLQLSVEVILNDPFVADRINRDRDFGQTIYDALYYPTHRWYFGDRTIDCSAEALVEGMTTLAGEEIDLPEDDRDFLHAQVKSLLDLIAAPARLKTRLKAAADTGRMPVSGPLRDAIPEQPALLVHDHDDVYEWIYNRYGIPYKAGDTIAIKNNPDLEAADRGMACISAALLKVVFTDITRLLSATTGPEALFNAFTAELKYDTP